MAPEPKFAASAAALARFFKIEDECAQAVLLKLLAQQRDVTHSAQ